MGMKEEVEWLRGLANILEFHKDPPDTPYAVRIREICDHIELLEFRLLIDSWGRTVAEQMWTAAGRTIPEEPADD